MYSFVPGFFSSTYCFLTSNFVLSILLLTSIPLYVGDQESLLCGLGEVIGVSHSLIQLEFALSLSFTFSKVTPIGPAIVKHLTKIGEAVATGLDLRATWLISPSWFQPPLTGLYSRIN